ncbi:MAG: sugar phosphate isomerase/epimerase [Verrucomicrobiae bacterium]|nr:sugar phosphate isomerase/epimerase [Verrucomicrobiae bacterium]
MTPKLSIRLEVLPGTSVAEQVAGAKRFGFDAIALPGRFKDRWLPGLRECLADSPLPMSSISLGFRHSLLSPDPLRRRQCRDSLMELLDLCAELGAGMFNFPPCLSYDNPERLSDRAECDALLFEQLPALADAARDRDVLFLLEPVNKYESDYLNSIEHAANVSRKLNHPNLACTADFFHMQIEELRIDEALSKAGNQVRHVHVAENTRVEPGPGSLQFRPGFKSLKDSGYTGFVEVECRYLSGPAETVLPRSAEYLRREWEAAV